MEELRRLLSEHLERYPQLTAQDLAKLIYQNEFGSGHFINDEEASLARLQEEVKGLKYIPGDRFEDIGNGLVRLHLQALGDSLSLQTVNRLFVLTAAQKRGSMKGFEAKLAALREFCPAADLDSFLAEYKEAGYPPMSHSPRYKEHYSPSYRVLCRFSALYFPVFERIERLLKANGSANVVAIDGRCSSGKSSLGQLLKDVYGCPVISMDDFFLQPEQRSVGRLAEPGGNIDYERFEREVKPKLKSGVAFRYQIYDCQQNAFALSPLVEPHRLTIVEGSYSHHPKLTEKYDLRIFLTVSPKVQEERLLERNGPALLERFVKEWIPLEERYFSTLGIAQKSDLILDTGA